MGNPLSRTLLGGALLLGLATGCGSPRGNGPGPDEDSGAAPGDAPIGADDRGGTGVDVPLFPDDRGGTGIDVPPFPEDRGAVPDAGELPDLQGPTFDIPAPEDRGPVDVPRVDRPDVPAPADAGAGAFACGTLTGTPIPRAAGGGVARVVGDTTAAWMAQNPGGVATGNSPIRPPSSSTACLPSRGQVVYSYTVGATPAGLTISTTNPGTQRNFDTVLWVTSRCATTLTTAACNDDDDAYASSADRRVSSSVTTDVLPAGATVFVVVGGYYPNSGDGTTVDRGPFELTVQEFSPVGAGGSCRIDGRGQRCDTTVVPALACVGGDPGAETGTCRVRGSIAGSPCRASAPQCDAGLTCSPNSICQSVVATGGACDAFRACEAGSACVSLAFGATRGTCVRAGSALASPCRPVGATGGRCDAGLVCSADYNPGDTNPTCVQLAPSGGACALFRTVCPTGQSCVTVHGGLIGTCRADGTAATAACRGGTSCDGGLVCRAPGEGAAPRCVSVAAVGGRCDEFTDCPDGSGCFLTDLSDRFGGRCGAVGSLGGSCSGSGTGCTSPTSCSAAGGAATGICQNERAVGASCARPTDRCAAGATCVLNAGSFTAGTCRAAGSAAGTECRTGDMPCSAGLACSGTALSQGVCQATAASGGACDPLGATTRCPTGQVCQAASSASGTCRAVGSTEAEPNDTPVAVQASPVTGGTTRRGALPFGDVDCVAINVPSNGAVVALVGDGNGRCPVSPGGITLDLYSPDGFTVRGSSSNSALGRCAMIDGTRSAVFPYAAGLAAGRYSVCVRGFRDPTSGALTGPVADYVLSVSTSP